MKLDSQNEVTMKRPPDGIYSFHPEDRILAKVNDPFVLSNPLISQQPQYASHSLPYSYQSPLPSLIEETRTRDSFGLDIRGRVFLIEGGGEKLREMGESMAELFGTD